MGKQSAHYIGVSVQRGPEVYSEMVFRQHKVALADEAEKLAQCG